MLFQSFIFIFVFLPAVFILYWARPERSYKQTVLVIASYIFYGYWDYRFVVLLFVSSLVDYLVAPRIAETEKPTQKRFYLSISIATNLSILGFFKYWDFFADSTNRLFALFGFGPPAPLLHIVLPVGISFYTFQSMSYTIDVYRGKTAPTRSLLKFLAFVSIFPQLVAGPIVRWTEMEQQLDTVRPRYDSRQLALGAGFFIVGLFKKVCIADLMYPLVDPQLFGRMTAAEFWPSFVGWTFWLYFDFSSYSDMAVGLGLFLGIELPINFDSPYRSQSISELWKRWHVTLGRWMRDYLFFPLGGFRRGFKRSIVNFLIAFFLIGLWHGAGWNTVLWGVYQGIGVIVSMLFLRAGIRIRSPIIKNALVMAFWINSCWLFLGENLAMSAGFVRAAFGANGLGSPNWLTVAVVLLCFVHAHKAPNLWEWKWKYSWREAVVLGLMFALSVPRMFQEKPFFYFQF